MLVDTARPVVLIVLGREDITLLKTVGLLSSPASSSFVHSVRIKGRVDGVANFMKVPLLLGSLRSPFLT